MCERNLLAFLLPQIALQSYIVGVASVFKCVECDKDTPVITSRESQEGSEDSLEHLQMTISLLLKGISWDTLTGEG